MSLNMQHPPVAIAADNYFIAGFFLICTIEPCDLSDGHVNGKIKNENH